MEADEAAQRAAQGAHRAGLAIVGLDHRPHHVLDEVSVLIAPAAVGVAVQRVGGVGVLRHPVLGVVDADDEHAIGEGVLQRPAPPDGLGVEEVLAVVDVQGVGEGAVCGYPDAQLAAAQGAVGDAQAALEMGVRGLDEAVLAEVVVAIATGVGIRDPVAAVGEFVEAAVGLGDVDVEHPGVAHLLHVLPRPAFVIACDHPAIARAETGEPVATLAVGQWPPRAVADTVDDVLGIGGLAVQQRLERREIALPLLELVLFIPRGPAVSAVSAVSAVVGHVGPTAGSAHGGARGGARGQHGQEGEPSHGVSDGRGPGKGLNRRSPRHRPHG